MAEITNDEFLVLAEKADTEKRPFMVIFQDTDGNWRGVAKNKYSTLVFARDVGPDTVLQLLMTHDGKAN